MRILTMTSDNCRRCDRSVWNPFFLPPPPSMFGLPRMLGRWSPLGNRNPQEFLRSMNFLPTTSPHQLPLLLSSVSLIWQFVSSRHHGKYLLEVT